MTLKKDIGAALEQISDPQKQQAAMVLARSGYVRGQNRKTGSIGCAARAAGVSYQCIYIWLDDPSFVQCIEELKALMLNTVITNLEDQSKKNNVIASIFLAKTLAPDLYDEKLRYLRLKHQFDLELQAAASEAMQKVMGELPPITVIASSDIPDPPEELLKFLH